MEDIFNDKKKELTYNPCRLIGHYSYFCIPGLSISCADASDDLSSANRIPVDESCLIGGVPYYS
jgi:hypothetical protein